MQEHERISKYLSSQDDSELNETRLRRYLAETGAEQENIGYKGYTDYTPPEDDDEELSSDFDVDTAFERMTDLISSLDPDKLDEDQGHALGDVLNAFKLLEDEEDEESDDKNSDKEAEDTEEYYAASNIVANRGGKPITEKRIEKISRKKHKAAHLKYRKMRAKLKRISKMYRKSARFKMWKKKHKRMVKAGRTRTKKYV